MTHHRGEAGGALTIGDFTQAVVPDNRRREARAACDRPIDIMPVTPTFDEPHLRALLIDCSPHGLGLIVERPMSAGDQFLVDIVIGQHPVQVLYTVRHCRAAGEHAFKVGAAFSAFISGPDDAAPVALFAALLEAGHTEQK